ncbi:unnamed protein product [Camellia sinensis]
MKSFSTMKKRKRKSLNLSQPKPVFFALRLTPNSIEEEEDQKVHNSIATKAMCKFAKKSIYVSFSTIYVFVCARAYCLSLLPVDMLIFLNFDLINFCIDSENSICNC